MKFRSLTLSRAAHALSFALLIVTVFLAPHAARAAQANAPDVDFASLETNDFRILSPDECRAAYSKMIFDHADTTTALKSAIDSFTPGATPGDDAFMSWTPTGALAQPNKPECTAERLEQVMLAARGNTGVEGRQVSGFINICGSHLTRNSSSSLWALIKLFNAQYPLCENPLLRKVVMKIPDGTILRGFLALKPGAAKRPLVIFRAGIYGSAGDVSDRMVIMHLFDEGPFNVLTLGNMTGTDFVRDNGYLALGGLAEGQQMMQLGQMIRTSPLNQHISTMHILGISLGGQGIFYASQMNDANFVAGRPLFSSAMSVSPVVDLEASEKDLFGNPLKGRLARWMFFHDVFKNLKTIPGIGNLFPDPDIAPMQIPPVVAKQAFLYYATQKRDWLMKPFVDIPMYNIHDFWMTNNFLDHSALPVHTPLLAIAADDDMIVLTAHNTARLATATSSASASNLSAVTVPTGNHGAFGMIYGWDIASMLLRTHFLMHSPDLMRSRSNGYAVFPTSRISYWSRLYKGSETHAQQTFQFRAGVASLRIKFQIFSSYQQNQTCLTEDRYTAESGCYRTATSDIPFAELGGTTPWAYVPRTATEAEAMSRWANRNLTVLDAQNEPISGKNTDGAALRWVSYAGE